MVKHTAVDRQRALKPDGFTFRVVVDLRGVYVFGIGLVVSWTLEPNDPEELLRFEQKLQRVLGL